MALLRGYIKKTCPTGVIRDYIGAIEPKYADVAVVRSYYISTAGRAILYFKWAGIEWDEVDTKSVPTPDFPFDCGWMITKTARVTVYADNLAGVDNEIIVYYELEEKAKVEGE